jgi:hypothetical protein
MLIIPQRKWEARMMKLLMGDQIVGAREASFIGGKVLCVAKRHDGLFAVVWGDWVGKPSLQILDLALLGDQLAYVAYSDDFRNNLPRVVWNEAEGKPYEAIEQLSLAEDGRPLYIAAELGRTFVVHGVREGKHYDKVGFLSFTAGQPLYVAQSGKTSSIVWGSFESDPCDDISRPRLDGKEIEAFATKDRRIYRLTIKVA